MSELAIVAAVDTSLVAAVLAGAASFLSPCVLPLLPGYLSLMSGYSTRDIAEGNASMWKVTRATLLFISGFTLVFVVLFGGAASSFGRLLSESIFTTIAGWVIIVMGLFIAVTAVWQPAFLLPVMKDRRKDVRPSRFGVFAPPIMGMAFAFGWTPCIGPFLGAAITLGLSAETGGETGRAMLVLGFYSLGLGIPFLVSSLLLAKTYSVVNGIKRFLTPISVFSGLLLALFGVLMVTGQVNELSSFFDRVLRWIGLESLTTV
ncbi:MAG: cytochrome c biogenesis protein CcdA [Acidimicrobiia bacterium]|nr:cytochrome c biogenesis protein CcdA [Acidimicrobiia bacterium]